MTSVLNDNELATAIGESVNCSQPYTSTLGYAPNDLPGGTGVGEDLG